MPKTQPDQVTPSDSIHELIEQRFPLLPRTKPICRPLDVRVARVRQLALLAEQRTSESLVRAGEA